MDTVHVSISVSELFARLGTRHSPTIVEPDGELCSFDTLLRGFGLTVLSLHQLAVSPGRPETMQ
jgi:hypothetical protein